MRDIASDIASISSQAEGKPLFICTLLIDTHTPFNNGVTTHYMDSARPDLNFKHQVQAIEYLDSWFPRLLAPLTMTGQNTQVIITSDHGELLGPEYIGHNPRLGKGLPHNITFDEGLFAIPFIRGQVASRRPGMGTS